MPTQTQAMLDPLNFSSLLNIPESFATLSSKRKAHILRTRKESLKTVICTLVDLSSDDVIDVESVGETKAAPYDATKARQLMEECERQVDVVRTNCVDDSDWEESICKSVHGSAHARNRYVKIWFPLT